MKSLVLARTSEFTVYFILLSILVWSVTLSYGGEKDELKRLNSEGPVEVEAVFLNPLLKETGNT